jgi:hypothetical protein
MDAPNNPTLASLSALQRAFSAFENRHFVALGAESVLRLWPQPSFGQCLFEVSWACSMQGTSHGKEDRANVGTNRGD